MLARIIKLVAYYEDRDNGEIVEFMRIKCWRTF